MQGCKTVPSAGYCIAAAKEGRVGLLNVSKVPVKAPFLTLNAFIKQVGWLLEAVCM